MDCFFFSPHRKFAGTLPGKWGQRWQAEDINTVIKVLVRSLGDTRVSVVISPQQQRWLIGRQPHGGHVGGKMGWERWFFFSDSVFFGAGGCWGILPCHALGCKHSWAFRGFSAEAQWAVLTLLPVCQTTCQARNLHIYQLQTEPSTHTHTDTRAHLPAKHPNLIIESMLAPYCAPRGSSAHKMVTAKNPDGLQQAGWDVSQCKMKHHAALDPFLTVWLLGYCTIPRYYNILLKSFHLFPAQSSQIHLS